MSQYKQGVFFSQEFVGESSWNGYERNCLFARHGERYVDVARAAGADVLYDSRGVGVADLDGDGRLDLVVAANDAPPTLLMNRHGASNAPGERPWLALRLRGRASNPDAVGARVRLTAGGKTMTRVVEAGSGYASQSQFPVHFGLGSATRLQALEIDWPSGRRSRWAAEQLAAEDWVHRLRTIEEPADDPAERRPENPSGATP